MASENIKRVRFSKFSNGNEATLVKRAKFWIAFFKMNPITSTVAASCNRLVLSPRSSPRSSPRASPNVLRKAPFLDLPADDLKKRRDSKEVEDYKKQLAATTRQAYKEKRVENKKANNAAKGSTPTTKEKPAKRLLEEAVSATVEKQKHGKKTTNTKASKSPSNASKKDKKCTIM